MNRFVWEPDEFTVGKRKVAMADHGFKRKEKPSDGASRNMDGKSGNDSGVDLAPLVSRGIEQGIRRRTSSDSTSDRRFHHGRTLKASSAESILRYVLRQRGWSGAWRRGELTDKELLALLSDMRDYGMAWLHHEADGLFRRMAFWSLKKDGWMPPSRPKD